MKEREENRMERYEKVQMKKDTSAIPGKKTPVIKNIYDPLSGLRDGTITPNAPIVIIGENLCVASPGEIHLGLSPASDKDRFIEIRKIYKYTDRQVLLLVPRLEPGEYFLVMKVCAGCETDFVYPLPMLPWRVVEEEDVDAFASSMRRNSRFLI